MFKRIPLKPWTVMVVLLLTLLVMVGTAVSQERPPELVTVDVRDALTGEIVPTEMHPVEAEAYLNRKLPPSALENAVAFMGRDLVFESDMQRLDMVNNKMRRISDAVKIDPDLRYPKGPVIGWGVNHEGRFFVWLHKGSAYDQSMMDRMYAEFNAKARQEGLVDVPVVFQQENLPELTRTQKRRPVFGGLKVSKYNGSYATLGYAARIGSTLGYVISGHFAPNTSLAIYQPTVSSDNKISNVGKVGGTRADASWVPYSNVTPKIYIYSSFFRDVTGWGDPYIGLNVYKSGITTLLTSGEVTKYLAEVSHPTFGSLEHQWVAHYTSEEGDSGAPVYNVASGNGATVRGIHWAKIMSGVQTDLGAIPLKTSDL